MKKWMIVSLAVTVALASALIVLRTLGIFAWFRSATPANSPTINTGEIVFTSNVLQSKRGDFIVFKSAAMDSANYTSTLPYAVSLYIYRICGNEGDTLFMKNQVLYVNKKNADSLLNLMLYYRLKIEEIKALGLNYDSLIALSDYKFYNEDSTIGLFYESAKVQKILAKPAMLPEYYANNASGAFSWLSKKSSAYHIASFGPFIVPPGVVFVMGDNRFNALDSRFVGFVEKRNILAKVLWK
jgi:signal peptidase I